MCIICIKPKGQQLPSTKTRRQMWRRNPDGAGFMYCSKGRVIIEKGFMEFEAMEARLRELSARIDITKTPLVLHYRITTHGGTCPQLTHPFPLSANPRALRTTHMRTALGIAHNGIIPIATRPELSDTAEYIADVLSRLPHNFAQDRAARSRIEREINGSRMVFLSGDGVFTTVGNWLHGDDGCLYSNGSYIEPQRITSPYGKFSVPASVHNKPAYDDLDEDDYYAGYGYGYAHYYEDGLFDETGDDHDDVEDFRNWLRSRDW